VIALIFSPIFFFIIVILFCSLGVSGLRGYCSPAMEDLCHAAPGGLGLCGHCSPAMEDLCCTAPGGFGFHGYCSPAMEDLCCGALGGLGFCGHCSPAMEDLCCRAPNGIKLFSFFIFFFARRSLFSCNGGPLPWSSDLVFCLVFQQFFLVGSHGVIELNDSFI
jgi:hypothetical protein